MINWFTHVSGPTHKWRAQLCGNLSERNISPQTPQNIMITTFTYSITKPQIPRKDQKRRCKICETFCSSRLGSLSIQSPLFAREGESTRTLKTCCFHPNCILSGQHNCTVAHFDAAYLPSCKRKIIAISTKYLYAYSTGNISDMWMVWSMCMYHSMQSMRVQKWLYNRNVYQYGDFSK